MVSSLGPAKAAVYTFIAGVRNLDWLKVNTIKQVPQLYTDSDPLLSALWLCFAISCGIHVLSLLTGNCSWVDRIWSVVPFVYCWHFALVPVVAGESFSDRALIMCGLTTMWGLRLSYNFYRKGGYNPKDEDYRWEVIRKIINNSFLYQIFNLTFISFYQNYLLLAITLPAYHVYMNRGTPLNTVDYIATGLFLLLLLGETTADQQQWNFYAARAKNLTTGPYKDDIRRRFFTGGLFRYSRHPNFFCEQSMWWVLNLFATAASGQWVTYCLIGAILLTALFLGSTAFTENISAGKYPTYKLYQQTTSRLIPWFAGPTVTEMEQKKH